MKECSCPSPLSSINDLCPACEAEWLRWHEEQQFCIAATYSDALDHPDYPYTAYAEEVPYAA